MLLEELRIPRDETSVGDNLAAPRGAGPFPRTMLIHAVKFLDDFAGHVAERRVATGSKSNWGSFLL
jgi:hypothetical protein